MQTVYRRAPALPVLMLAMAAMVLGSCATTARGPGRVFEETEVPGAALFDQTLASIRLVRTETIGEEEFMREVRQLEALAGKPMGTDDRKKLMDYLVEERLLVQASQEKGMFIPEIDLDRELEAKRTQLGIASEEEFRTAILQSFPSIEAYRASIRSQMLRDRYLASEESGTQGPAAPISDQEILAVYQQNLSQFALPKIVQFQHLFVPASALNEANRPLATARMQAIADEVAAKGLTGFTAYATGPGLNQEYLFNAVQIAEDPQFYQAYGEAFIKQVLALGVDKPSGLLVSNQGLHVVVVRRVQEGRVFGLDDPVPIQGRQITPRELIRSNLVEQQKTAERATLRKNLVARLRERADIFINPDYDWTKP